MASEETYYNDETLVENIRSQFEKKIINKLDDIDDKFVDMMRFLSSAQDVSCRYGDYLDYKYNENGYLAKQNAFDDKAEELYAAIKKSQDLMTKATTDATTLMPLFEFSGSTTPRINSPYDYVSYLKKQGKYKEAASIQSLIKSGVIGASLVTKNGTKSKNNNVPDKNTGTETGNVSTVYTSPSSSDKSDSQDNDVIKTDEEEKEKLEEFEEKLKDKEEKLKKEQEEVEKQQEEIKKQQDEIAKKQEELAKKEEELKKTEEELNNREQELNNREQELNNKPANGTTTPNDSNNGNNNAPSDNNTYNNNNNNSAPQNTVYRQENTTPVANNSTAPAETGTVDTPTTTPATPEKVENTTPSTKGDSGSLGTGNDLFGDDPEPTTTPTTLPDADTTTKSSKSGFNPIPIAVGLGAAVAGGVGVKAYKNHKQNSEFDDTNEDSFTNGNRFWTDDEPNVVNSEQNEINSDELFNEQTTAPSYSAVTNQANNSDTWSVQDTSTSEDDSRTYDLLGEN